jgi:16S rRNA (guanine966-N2)-methyltransferase
MPRRRPSTSRKPAKHSPNSVKPAPSTLRIIGGEWRSRKLAFHPAEGLRPTLDRVRETLFNWLSPYIEGAHCLDLFSGSGALTLEALSRGAAFVHINELNPDVRNTLRSQLELVSCDPSRYQLTGFNGETPPMDSLSERFDILFLDPPFRKELLESCCQTLEALSIFKPRSWIYLESEQPLEQLALPNNWQLIKQKKAGQTHYGLVERIEAP